MDLTKITAPFGLLDAETQKALREHCGPFEFYNYQGLWSAIENGEWMPSLVYRVKPQPPKPREFWIALCNDGLRTGYCFSTEQEARDNGWLDGKIIHVREVLP